MWEYCAESAESVSDGTDPNDVPGGTAPDSPVQLPEFTAVDQSGSDFSLAQLQVCFVHLQTISSIPIGMPSHRDHVAAAMTASIIADLQPCSFCLLVPCIQEETGVYW